MGGRKKNLIKISLPSSSHKKDHQKTVATKEFGFSKNQTINALHPLTKHR